jgi:hypothetical protein
MGFTAPKPAEGGNFTPTPAGNFIGRCFGLIDLGTQTNETGEFAGKSNHKIKIEFELFGEDSEGNPMTIDVDGKTMPMVISKEYTLSMHEKSTLRKELGSWRGKAFLDDDEAVAFDITKLVGAYAMVNIAHKTNTAKGKTYANIANLSPLPSALKNAKPAAVHANRIFNLDAPDLAMFDTFYEYLQETIRKSPEWKNKVVNHDDFTSDEDMVFGEA